MPADWRELHLGMLAWPLKRKITSDMIVKTFLGLLASLPVLGFVNEIGCLCKIHRLFGGGKFSPAGSLGWALLHPAHTLMRRLRN